MLVNEFPRKLYFEAFITWISVKPMCYALFVFQNVHLPKVVLKPFFPCDFFLFRRTYYYTTKAKVQLKLLILDQAAMNTKEVCRKVKLM